MEEVSAHASTTALVAVREVLRNAAIRRIEIAWTAGTAADGAFLVVLLVVAYDAGGALAAGILGAIRVIPWIVPPRSRRVLSSASGAIAFSRPSTPSAPSAPSPPLPSSRQAFLSS
jgi:hypothetical protein